MPWPTIVVLFVARSTDEQSWPILTLTTRICQKDRKLSIGETIVASFCALVNRIELLA